jgi:hypothetical protein
MRMTTLAIFAAALATTLAIDTASAAERHHARKAPAPVSQSVRNSNASIWPSTQQSEPDRYRDYNGGGAISAPAGQ